MTNSRNKGASGEREFSNVLFELTGVKLERQLDQCRSGGFDLAPPASDYSPMAQALREFAVEVKRYRTANDAQVSTWWTQAARQAEDSSLKPLLAYRADRQAWRVVLQIPGTTHLMTISPDALSDLLH